ncbi:NrfD/PsrC family molybdoenzyme membrane anchor subunit [Photobacterium sp. MCCC 1A19761]|uniref:NrfD/PsrC family molybdoenzyme membrane anchor subunit n=1 Tax=Photobacterium sp. MCCC 1A19761 TaxID=3115000 RepID=UPI00307D24DE
MMITEILVPAQDVAWLPWVVQYFFYIGSAYAAALLFVLSLLFRRQTSHRLRAALVLVMAIGAMVGPLALTGDLHQPGRAWHFYAHFTPWSWMSLGSLFLPIFTALAVFTAWLYLRADLAALSQSERPLIRKLAWLTLGSWSTPNHTLLASAIVTALSGLTIALYTGAEIAVVASRPLWHQPASPLLWFVTAFLAAVGFTALIYSLLPSDRTHSAQLTPFDHRLLRQTTTSAAVLAFLLIPIWAANNPGFTLYERSDWIINLSVLSLSMLLAAVSSWLVLGRERQVSRLSLGLLTLTTLVAAWLTRWISMIEVQTLARFDAGPYPYQLPLGTNGLLGIAGMFGLWLALALLGSELIQGNAKTGTAPPDPHHPMNHPHISQ